ncbi:MAG: peptide deformylase, partial [Allorhizobium sp.]
GDMDCEYEWCPSVRDLMAILLRHAHVRIHCLDEQGQARQHELRGWPARIAQRLMDSLRGVYLTDYGAVRTYTSVENYVKGVCTPMPVVRAMMQQAAQGREFPSARVERLLPQR